MLEYILALMNVFCNGDCLSVRERDYQETARAIESVAETPEDARWLVVIAFSETGFRTHSYTRGTRLVRLIPFGAQAHVRRHPNATLVDLANSALRNVHYGAFCGRNFSNRMRMYITGWCSTNRLVIQESVRRQNLLRRLRPIQFQTARLDSE